MRFPDLADRVSAIRSRIDEAIVRGGHGQRVEMIAITKTHGVDAVRAAYEAGLRKVGENRVQEALSKMDEADVDVEWHLVGHLQRNKAKFAKRFALIHSLDTPRLADALNEAGLAEGSPLRVLVQVNVSGEESKGGFSASDLTSFAPSLAAMSGLDVVGVMTMAPYGAREDVLRATFGGAREAREALQHAGLTRACELSMGMSDDFEIAVEEGATMVRLGTILFGART